MKGTGSQALILGAAVLALCASPPAVRGATTGLFGELNLVAGHTRSAGWVTEFPGVPRNSVGFEYFRKLSGEGGDFLTVDVQARLSHDSPSQSDDEWGFEIHNAWAEYKLGLGRNVVFGHFSPAFGLEPELDTHGTVLQTLAMQDIGFKKDWGAGYRGILGPFDLRAAGQLGSGMGIQTRDGSFLLTAQLWEPPGDGFRYGLSVLAGRVLPSRGGWTVPAPEYAGEAVAKARLGAAAELLAGSFDYRGEVTAGVNDDSAVAGILARGGYVPPSLQSLKVELQARAWSADLEQPRSLRASVTAGASFELTRTLTLRAYVTHDIEEPGGVDDTGVLVQIYYFGG
jgi:hypothetical protein